MSQLNLSQADLARRSGVSKQTVSDYINRKRSKPDPVTLARIANALSLSVELVYQAAGIPTSPIPQDEIALEEFRDILAQLTPENREKYRRQMLIDIEYQQKQEEAERNKRRKPGTGPLPETT